MVTMNSKNITLQEREIMECAAEWVTVYEIMRNTRFTRDSLQDKLPEMVKRNLLAIDETEKTYHYRSAVPEADS